MVKLIEKVLRCFLCDTFRLRVVRVPSREDFVAMINELNFLLSVFTLERLARLALAEAVAMVKVSTFGLEYTTDSCKHDLGE